MTTISSALPNVTRYGGEQTLDTSDRNNDLGQDDFLKLMTAQLQNQDPFAPMENGDFLAQMAQFSTVSGIEDVNSTLASISEGLGDFRVATAATMLGQHVLVPGTIARADDMGTISGVVDFENPVEAVRITYENADTGEIYETQDLGYQSAGIMGFSWDDVPQELQDAQTPVRIIVAASSGGQSQIVGPSVFARVMSINMADASTGINLNVQDYGVINAMEINEVR